VLHHQERRPVGELIPVDDLDDVRMRQVRDHVGLAAEPGEHLGILRRLGGDRLECERSTEARVADLVDRAHAALGELANHLVATRDDRADERISDRGAHGGDTLVGRS
jgi:hypothetical protein